MQWSKYCGTALDDIARCTVKSERHKRRSITFKIALSEIGGNCRLSMDEKPRSGVPRRSSTINRLEVLCKSCYFAWFVQVGGIGIKLDSRDNVSCDDKCISNIW